MISVWGIDHGGDVSKAFGMGTISGLGQKAMKLKPVSSTVNAIKPMAAKGMAAAKPLAARGASAWKGASNPVKAGVIGGGAAIGGGAIGAGINQRFSKAVTRTASQRGGPPPDPKPAPKPKPPGNNPYKPEATRPKDATSTPPRKRAAPKVAVTATTPAAAAPAKRVRKPMDPAVKAMRADARAKTHAQNALNARASRNKSIGSGFGAAGAARRAEYASQVKATRNAGIYTAFGRNGVNLAAAKKKTPYQRAVSGVQGLKLKAIPHKGKIGMIGAGVAAAGVGAGAFASRHDKKAGRSGFKYNPYEQ